MEIIRSLVRPIIAIGFTAATLYLAYLGKVDAKDILGILGIIIGFYFGERAALKTPGVVEQHKPPVSPDAP